MHLLLPYTLTLLLIPSVLAIPSLPIATIFRQQFDLHGWSPAPTAAPGDSPNAPHVLFGRQASSAPSNTLTPGQLLGFLAPDNTCGYIDASRRSLLTCDATQQCAAVTADAVGCCDTAVTGSCTFFGTCYDVAELSSTSCGASCQSDINIVLCTASSLTVCNLYTMPDLGAAFFRCGSSSQNGTDDATLVYTTYDGGSTVEWEPVTQTSELEPVSTPRPVSTDDGIELDGETTTSSSVGSDDSNGTGARRGGGGGTPIGPIVGGVVGGVGGLALIGAAAWLLLRRHKKKKLAAGPASGYSGPPQQQPPMSPQAPMSPAPSGGAYYAQQDYKPPAPVYQAPQQQTYYPPPGQNPHTSTYGQQSTAYSPSSPTQHSAQFQSSPVQPNVYEAPQSPPPAELGTHAR